MAEHSTVAISNGGKCESHSDIRWMRHRLSQKRKWAASSNCDCARMVVAQMVELSQMTSPAPKTASQRTTKTNSEGGRSPSPTPPVLRPPSPPFCDFKENSVAERLRIISFKKNHSGFSAKNVRTLSRNCRKIMSEANIFYGDILHFARTFFERNG